MLGTSFEEYYKSGHYYKKRVQKVKTPETCSNDKWGGGKKTEYNNINVNFSYLGYIKRIVNNLFKEYII
jgi:hypothetical protein